MQSWRAIPSFTVHRSQWRQHRIWVYSSLVSWWLGYWLDIEYLSLVWLSDIRAAGTMSHKLYVFRKILELYCSSIKKLCWSTGSGNVIPFSVDLSDFCRSFRVESKTTMKIYIGHDVLLINEVHNAVEKNSLFEILTTIWYKIIFWMQNRMNCKLCRIIKRDVGFTVAAHRFL